MITSPLHPGKHFVAAPEGYPIRGVWVPQDKTVLFIHPGPTKEKGKKLEYQIVKAAASQRKRW